MRHSKFLYYTSGIRSDEVDFETGAEGNSDYRRLFSIWKDDGGVKRWTGDEVRFCGRVYRFYTTLGRGRIYAEMESREPVDIASFDGYLCGFLFPGRNESRTYVAEGYEDCTNLVLWNDPDISPADCSVREKDTFMIPMRDGVCLATDVILPDSLG